MLRLKAAAEVLGVHPVTLRRWADQGQVPVVRPGRERRFRSEDLERFLGQAPKALPRREALYVRVSGLTGQESSLAACDRQAVTLTRTTGSSATLRVRLPRSSKPRSRQDWSWVSIPVRLPPTVPEAAELHTPTLRVKAGRVRVDLPFTMNAPALPGSGHQVGIGLDWGVNTFLVGALAKVPDQGRGRVISDGLPLRFAAGGAIAKWHNLRQEGEFLRLKITHLERLGGPWGPHPLNAKLALLRAHHQALCARQRQLGHGIAWAAARWATDQAICSGATVIYVEDLATLEPALGRKLNARVSASVRGQFQDALRHLGAQAGCAVVTVPARGPQPSARGVAAGCGTTPPLSDCAVATTGPTARIADSPRTATMPPLSASAPGASVASWLSTRIAGPGILRPTKPTTLRWPAACAAGPG